MRFGIDCLWVFFLKAHFLFCYTSQSRTLLGLRSEVQVCLGPPAPVSARHWVQGSRVKRSVSLCTAERSPGKCVSTFFALYG